MPVQTVDQVAARLERAKKKLAAIGEKSDAAKKRAARKNVKRAQRKRRRVAVAAAKQAGAGKVKKEA